MHALRFAVAALAASLLLAAAALGTFNCSSVSIWSCIDPATGKEDSSAPYDPTHYVNGVFDPCHCYDPGGPEPQCPILVDAGPDAH